MGISPQVGGFFLEYGNTPSWTRRGTAMGLKLNQVFSLLCTHFIFAYPAVPLFYFHLPCCALILFSLTLLCRYFIFAYPAVPFFT